MDTLTAGVFGVFFGVLLCLLVQWIYKVMVIQADEPEQEVIDDVQPDQELEPAQPDIVVAALEFFNAPEPGPLGMPWSAMETGLVYMFWPLMPTMTVIQKSMAIAFVLRLLSFNRSAAGVRNHYYGN